MRHHQPQQNDGTGDYVVAPEDYGLRAQRQSLRVELIRTKKRGDTAEDDGAEIKAMCKVMLDTMTMTKTTLMRLRLRMKTEIDDEHDVNA